MVLRSLQVLVTVFPIITASTSYLARTPWITKRAASDRPVSRILRGGAESVDTTEEPSLDEKVYAAMRKLGLQVPEIMEADDEGQCKDGVCELPTAISSSTTAVSTDATTNPPQKHEDPRTIVKRLSEQFQLQEGMVWAALGATSSQNGDGSRLYNESAARELLQVELEMVSSIPETSESVQKLIKEGHTDVFLVRRALAFAEGNLDNARAILIADEEEEEEQEEEEEAAPPQQAFKTVQVDANFDPTKLGSEPATPSMPSPAPKGAVVFEATTAEVFELVLESPVPVLLDIYADWCGPCKALSPILEEMAIKSGGSFRLVKVNSDNERAVAGALQVTALPTIFGVRDGKILHMFQGMPKSEEMMKNFLMGLLIPGQSFSPPVTDSEKQTYGELTNKLIKVTGAAGFSFSARERLQDRVTNLLNELVDQTGNVLDAEESARTVRSLLGNVILDPFGKKFRTINLFNKIVAAKVAKYPAALALLGSVGFATTPSDTNTLRIGANKKLINITPLSIARDAIDSWVDKMRYDVARAARQRKDEEDKKVVQAELAARAAEQEEEEEESDDDFDPNQCRLKLRVEGKNKIHDVVLQADDSLETVLQKVPGLSFYDDDEIQITCVAKRLILKSTDETAMKKTLRDHGLLPSAALVLKRVGSSTAAASSSSSTLSERAAKKKKKTGSHTMQSIGIYAKDDNAKGELIDGGGGVWYEHDVTDDEGEEEPKDKDEPDKNKESSKAMEETADDEDYEAPTE